ncbi:hypothetical protein [Qipengyuania sp. ASV99]|uniref:hypothetical protein n=1 Tax=Qipengyuania sp. ASV99 TaxID=3399681 RepID=UPI003A4C6233
MFGFGKRKRVRITSFSEKDARRFHDFLCDGVIAEHIGDFAALREIHAELQAVRPQECVLATLDNPWQAVYTMFHTIGKHRLDDTRGHDLSALGPECFEDGEHLGHLSTLAEFPIRLTNLQARAAELTLEDACGVLQWKTGAMDGQLDPIAVMSDPDAALRIANDREVHFQFVPVATASDALAALPNGYFMGSLDPMQSYALARHLERRHAMALIGVGSRFFGYARSIALTNDEAHVLARDLVKLHENAPDDAEQRLAAALVGKDWLLLRFTEV